MQVQPYMYPKPLAQAEHTVVKSSGIYQATLLLMKFEHLRSYLDVSGSSTIDNTLYVKEGLSANKALTRTNLRCLGNGNF